MAHDRSEEAKVLLVNPNRMKPPVVPIALDYLGSALDESGHRADLLDLCFCEDFAAEIESYLSSNDVSAVAFTLRNTDDTCLATRDFFLPGFKEMLDCLRAHTDAPIILGGSGFSVMPEAILEYCGLGLGIWGEGERALPLLVDRLAAGEDYSDIPGLVYRTPSGFERCPPAYLELESLAAPARALVDNRRYFMEGGMGAIETKRGCPQPCIYCADPVGKGRRVRLCSPMSVAHEIQSLLAMGIDHFHLCDSEFNLPSEHAEEVCRGIIDSGLGEKVRWHAYCRPVPFDDSLATLFQRAGCAGINFGADSADWDILRILRRGFTFEDLERTAQVCHRQGIVFLYDLLLGGPGETRDSLRETVEAMKRLSPSRVGASLGVRIYPGTELADMVLGQGPLDSNPNLQGTLEGGFVAPAFYLSAELGEDAYRYLDRLIAGDERFFFMSGGEAAQDYNYSDNTLLMDAIRGGYRGAFWDILRRLGEGGSTSF